MREPSMMALCDPSTREAEAGEKSFQGPSGDYIERFYFKIKGHRKIYIGSLQILCHFI
jgi:hypothetical protein